MFAVAFSPDGKRLATAGADRAIRVFDVATRKQQLLIEDHADWVMDVAWLPDGSKLISASRDKTAKVFDAKTGDSLVTFNGHAEPVFGVAAAPDGKTVITSGRDKSLRRWNVADAKEVQRIDGFGDEVLPRRGDAGRPHLQLQRRPEGPPALAGGRQAADDVLRAIPTGSIPWPIATPPSAWPPARSTAKFASGTSPTARI